ncbi:FAD/NAD(P)-binding protein (plasmid) [Deefgea piscis]|uniref:FAD/NAD(P)-binding protein n=1 Tax=Deefgea piscis TaxID=2739061 RepID=A0A6M8SXF2_9NEIS|nr:FAD/NAD(P)-binding domain-containing protein [Deefgea piscis]QKJ68286.1 FAD/NAD(P)-binding protein [Deefgea piscis]
MVTPKFEVPTLLRVGIIGLGSRGLAILERLLALATELKEQHLHIIIFEPNQPGVGLHSCDQPDYLLLNTVAFQLSVFPDYAANQSAIERTGPDFYQWCIARGISFNEQPDATDQKLVAQTDFLPRRLIGEYLAWSFENITSILPPNVSLQLHRERAIKLQTTTEGGFLISSEAQIDIEVDKLFLTLGHTGRKVVTQTKRHITDVYPLPASIAEIDAGTVVGVEGFGLATMDVLASLSSGRGGRYIREDGLSHYLPSGNEPLIVLYSRTGLPFRVRPETTTTRKRHQPLFITPGLQLQLRKQNKEGQLDFVDDILPLMIAEMRAAFYLTHQQITESSDLSNDQLRDQLAHAFRSAKLDELFSALAEQYGSFDPLEYLPTELPPGLSGDKYVDWLVQFIKEDLAEGASGLTNSPIKAALEVWRDLRDTLRSLIDFKGLNETSHRDFYSSWVPLINRTVAGPQKERHQDFLALIAAGVVKLANPGDEPVWLEHKERYQLNSNHLPELDWLISARLPSSGLLNTDSSVLADLFSAGIVRPVYNSQGLDGVEIVGHGSPLNQAGCKVENLWVLGPLTEGATYYNHYIPSAGAYSRALSDAQGAVLECLGILAEPLIEKDCYDFCLP